MNYKNLVLHFLDGSLVTKYFYIANALVIICLIVLFSAIIFDFILYHNKEQVKHKKISIVDTFTMFLFFIFYCFVIKTGLGYCKIKTDWIRVTLITLSILLILIGTYVNVRGRFVLKDNWANQVTIYTSQKLINYDVYYFVRHPLYASLIWMLIGGALLYQNYFSLVLVFIVFIPMMYYRANQEEESLSLNIIGYKEYKLKTGMFFPKFRKYDSV